MFAEGEEFDRGGGEGEKNIFITTECCKTSSRVLL